MVFHWSLSVSKCPQVSRTLLSILTDLHDIVISMVSTRPFISKSSSLLNNPLVAVRKVPITIGIIVTHMFHSFLNSRAWSRHICFFSLSWSCYLVVDMLSCHLFLLVGRIFFRCFGMSCFVCFVCIVSLFVNIFLIFYLSPVFSGLFPQVVLLFFYVLPFLFVSTCSSVFRLFYHFDLHS